MSAEHDTLLQDYEQFLQTRVAWITRRRYLFAVRRFLTHHPTVPIAAITPEHIEHYITGTGLALPGARVDLKRLHTWFAFLVACKVVPNNPCAPDGLRLLLRTFAEQRSTERSRDRRQMREEVIVVTPPRPVPDPAKHRATPPTTPNEVLAQTFIARLERRLCAQTTIRSYRSTITRFLAFSPEVPLAAIDAGHIERFLDSLHVAPKCWGTYHNHLTQFFKHLIKREKTLLITMNPAEDVEKPRVADTHRPAPTRAEFEAMRRACRGPEETLLISVLYFTGMRIAELRAVRVRDIDLDLRRIQIHAGKGNKARMVLFTPDARGLIAEWMGGMAPDVPLLESRFVGHARSPKWIEDRLRRIGQDAHLPYKLTAHILRHGFARLCKTSGLPLEVCSRLMGHNDIQTTANIYGRLDDMDLQRAYDTCIVRTGA